MLRTIRKFKIISVSGVVAYISAAILLLIVQLLVFEFKVGALLTAGLVLILIALLKPFALYLMFLSLLSLDGFAALPGASYSKILALFLMGALGLRLTMTKGVLPKDDAYKYYCLFFAGSLASFAFAKDLSVSLSIYLTYLSLFCLYVFTRYFLINLKDIYDALDYVFISFILVFTIVQVMDITVNNNGSLRLTGGIGDPNQFAAFILVLLPLSFYRAIGSSGIRKIFYWGCVICFLTLLIFSESRGGFLGFLGASAILAYYYGSRRVRQLLIFIIITGIILVFIVPNEFWDRVSTIRHPETEKGESISTRVDNYRAALEIFLDYPLAGVGLYNFSLISRDYGASGGYVVHNTYLEVLTGGGLLSFIPFSLILINCWIKLRLKEKYMNTNRDLLICLKASFVSVLITSFFLSADHDKILWFLFALISSAFYISTDNVSSAHQKLYTKNSPAL